MNIQHASTFTLATYTSITNLFTTLLISRGLMYSDCKTHNKISLSHAFAFKPHIYIVSICNMCFVPNNFLLCIL